MKNWLFAVILLFSATAVYAVPPTREQSITAVGTPTTVVVSTSAWTKVPATSSLTGRHGILVDVPTGNTAGMAGVLDSCSGTNVAISVRPLEFTKADSFKDLPLPDSVCLYMLSLHSSTESVHVQEYQK